MKVAFLLILVGIFAAFLYVRQPTSLPTPAATQTQPLAISPNAQITLDERIYTVYWQEISESLTLVPNFDKQQTSSRIMEECTYGANGGFYTPDNKPIGLFIFDGVLLSPATTNATFNGYFVKTDHFTLTRQPPTNSAEFAVQSGPYVTAQSILKIKNDTFARRVLVGRSGSQWRFYAITEKDNVFDGPKLSDLPELLAKLKIDEALNLDGGSASAFYSTSGVRLGELTPIGSFFCGK